MYLCVVFSRDAQVTGLTFPACHRVSQRREEKGRLLKQRVLPPTCLLPTEHVISHHNSGLLLQEYSRVLDPGAAGALRQISDERRMAHNKNTDSVSFKPFFLLLFLNMPALDTIRNTKPVMHATGGKGLYQWMGHAFCFCLLGSLTITRRQTRTSCDSAATPRTQPLFSSYKSLLFFYSICASEGKMNAMIHSRFRERMPSNGSAVSISLLTQENVSCKFRSMRREIRRHVVEWQRI